MEFPKALKPSGRSSRASRMLEAGDVRVTVTNLTSGDHITVRFKSIKDNRPDNKGQRARPENDRNWIRVPLEEATHVFMEVPSASGDFPDKIGTFYPRTARFFPDKAADPERITAAIQAARWLNGEFSELVDAVFQEESNCGVCGRTLTDPESIERGIGPECYKQETKSHHQVKKAGNLDVEIRGSFDSWRDQDDDETEKNLIKEILEACAELSPAGQEKIRRDLEMWRSQ